MDNLFHMEAAQTRQKTKSVPIETIEESVAISSSSVMLAVARPESTVAYMGVDVCSFTSA